MWEKSEKFLSSDSTVPTRNRPTRRARRSSNITSLVLPNYTQKSRIEKILRKFSAFLPSASARQPLRRKRFRVRQNFTRRSVLPQTPSLKAGRRIKKRRVSATFLRFDGAKRPRNANAPRSTVGRAKPFALLTFRRQTVLNELLAQHDAAVGDRATFAVDVND